MPTFKVPSEAKLQWYAGLRVDSEERRAFNRRWKSVRRNALKTLGKVLDASKLYSA